MHPRPVFTFKPDFKAHSRSPSFLHHFLCFKAWLTSNLSQELTYNVYSINRMLWYIVWPTRFLTRFASSWSHQFKVYEIQPSPQTISCDHGEGVWIGLLDFIFGSKTSPSVFSQTAQPFCKFFLSHYVLLFVLFPMVYNMWVFVAREHHHYFRILDNGEARVL
jgi:hypothetical protein